MANLANLKNSSNHCRSLVLWSRPKASDLLYLWLFIDYWICRQCIPLALKTLIDMWLFGAKNLHLVKMNLKLLNKELNMTQLSLQERNMKLQNDRNKRRRKRKRERKERKNSYPEQIIKQRYTYKVNHQWEFCRKPLSIVPVKKLGFIQMWNPLGASDLGGLPTKLTFTVHTLSLLHYWQWINSIALLEKFTKWDSFKVLGFMGKGR